MHYLFVSVFLAMGLAAVNADLNNRQDRIVGGSETNIETYPEMAVVLFSLSGVNHRHWCGGTILNNRTILTAAHCFIDLALNSWRVRLGSTNANSGGTVFSIARIISHPAFQPAITESDVGIFHLTSAITFNNVMRPAAIAGSNYNLGDNQAVWATGWGRIYENGPLSEQLRHVQVWTINQQVCRNQYAVIGRPVTDNMLCTGWLNVCRDQCGGDSGGPLFHNRVVVGITSWGEGCARPDFPGVNARVSRFATWINDNL